MYESAGRRAREIAGRVWSVVRRMPPSAPAILGAVFAILYAFPGYMNYDAGSQLMQARNRAYDDWHAPMMARYWHLLDQLVHGPFLMLLLQVTLFTWGAYWLFTSRMPAHAAGFFTFALLYFAPVLAPLAVVWKDSQMAGFLMAGFMLLRLRPWPARVLGIVFLFFAAGVRDNGLFALPPLLLCAVTSWGYQRKRVVIGVAFALFVAIGGGAWFTNKLLTDGKSYAWEKANAIHDIAGMICFSDPMTDAEVKQDLAGIPLRVETGLQQRFCEQYTPRWWFPLSFNEKGLFNTLPDEADRAARRAAYFRLLRKHPGAFLVHRWRVTKELLGLGQAPPDEPICQEFVANEGQADYLHMKGQTRSFLQRVYGRKFVRWSSTWLFRPWIYMLIGAILLGYAVKKRDGLVISLIASGYLYEFSFMLAAAGSPFRYSNWLIITTCVATAIVFVDRLRSGFRARAAS